MFIIQIKDTATQRGFTLDGFTSVASALCMAQSFALLGLAVVIGKGN